MNSRRVLLALVLCGYVAGWGVLLHSGIVYHDLWLFIGALPLFSLALILLARAGFTQRAGAILVLSVAALLQIVALTSAPQTSDDAARYVWDAKVQLHGIDPYRYPPSSAQLIPLRDGDLFGTSSACAHPLPHSCTAINRPGVRTIYPPVAQLAFDGIRIVSFGRGFLFPYQLFAALGVLALGGLLVRWRYAAWQVAAWAWSPVVVLDLGNNAHIDWLAALFAVLAIRASATSRPVRAALLLGAAIATKLYPALLLPVLMRRRPVLAPVLAAALVLVGYLPHLAAVGTDIVGYLPGYLREEGYDSGERLLLLGRVLPHPFDSLVGAVLVGAVALWAWQRSDPHAPDQAAVLVVAVAFLVATPAYGWYAALLVALVAQSGRWEWLPLSFAPTLTYLILTSISHRATWDVLVYLGAALLSGVAFAISRRLSPRAGSRSPAPATP